MCYSAYHTTLFNVKYYAIKHFACPALVLSGTMTTLAIASCPTTFCNSAWMFSDIHALSDNFSAVCLPACRITLLNISHYAIHHFVCPTFVLFGTPATPAMTCGHTTFCNLVWVLPGTWAFYDNIRATCLPACRITFHNVLALCKSAHCNSDISAFRHFGTLVWVTHDTIRHRVSCRVDGARGDPVHQRLIPRRRLVRLDLCD